MKCVSVLWRSYFLHWRSSFGVADILRVSFVFPPNTRSNILSSVLVAKQFCFKMAEAYEINSHTLLTTTFCRAFILPIFHRRMSGRIDAPHYSIDVSGWSWKINCGIEDLAKSVLLRTDEALCWLETLRDENAIQGRCGAFCGVPLLIKFPDILKIVSNVFHRLCKNLCCRPTRFLLV